jgi:hypothetical protein
MTLISFNRRRFKPDTIRLAVWLYFRFTTSPRDVRGAGPAGMDCLFQSIEHEAGVGRRADLPAHDAPGNAGLVRGVQSSSSPSANLPKVTTGDFFTFALVRSSRGFFPSRSIWRIVSARSRALASDTSMQGRGRARSACHRRFR